MKMAITMFKIIFWIYIVGAICACIANYVMKKKGLEGISYKECFNPLKMLSVLIGFALKYIIPQHIFEQFVIRFYDEDCRSECILGNDGNCVACGCDTIAKMWSPIEECKKKRWGKIIWSKKKYTAYRQLYPLKIKIQYGNGII